MVLNIDSRFIKNELILNQANKTEDHTLNSSQNFANIKA